MVINLLQKDGRLFRLRRDLAGVIPSLIKTSLRSHAIGAPTENSALLKWLRETDSEEKKVKTHNDPLKLLSDTIPFGSLPRFLAASLPHLALEHKGVFEGWRYCRLVDVLPPAGCFNHKHTHARTETRTQTLKAHPRHRRSSLDVSKGAVLERQQERCEEEKICGLWPRRKWFIQGYKTSPQDQSWALIFGVVAKDRIAGFYMPRTPFFNMKIVLLCVAK